MHGHTNIKLLIKLLLLHLVGCLYYCINDARSHKHQTYKHSASASHMSSPESHFSNSISISDSLNDSCMPGLLFLKTFFSLFQIAILLLVSLTATRLSSPDTPATASCYGEVLNSFAHLALDCFAWFMAAEHFAVRWGMSRTSDGFTNFPPLEL